MNQQKSIPLATLIQEMTIDSEKELSSILRKAYSIAVRYELNNFKEWLLNELNGYKKPMLLPEYRIITSRLVLKSPVYGYIPCPIAGEDILIPLTTVRIVDSVSSLQELVRQHQDTFQHPVPIDFQDKMRKVYDLLPLEILRISTKNQLHSILDSIRTKLMDFSFEIGHITTINDNTIPNPLEKNNIDEIVTTVRIDNFQGVFGNINNSQLSQDMVLAINKYDFDSLQRHLKQKNVSINDINQLKKAIDSDNRPKKLNALGDNVSSWIGNMVTKAISGSWDISASIAGSFLYEAIKKFYGL